MDPIDSLEGEGFFVTRWRDEPNTRYDAHLHRAQEVCVVLEGSMTFETDGDACTLNAGDRLDIAPGTTHKAVVGPDGCTYLAGRKR